LTGSRWLMRVAVKTGLDLHEQFPTLRTKFRQA
jgi:hypothetical protein